MVVLRFHQYNKDYCICDNAFGNIGCPFVAVQYYVVQTCLLYLKFGSVNCPLLIQLFVAFYVPVFVLINQELHYFSFFRIDCKSRSSNLSDDEHLVQDVMDAIKNMCRFSD